MNFIKWQVIGGMNNMGRLLDMEEIIKVAKNTFPNEDVLKIAWVLTHTPTAYDVERVVAEIEWMFGVDPTYYGTEARWAVNKAIEKIRKGGIDG